MSADGNFISEYVLEIKAILDALDTKAIERLVFHLVEARERGGRLFILGVGGSAANASHAVNDFRKIAGLEAYTPTDNVSELTARINDEGWESVFRSWLKGSRMSSKDVVLVFSVSGGNMSKNISPNLVSALNYARSVGATILGIVGGDGGYTVKVADVCVLIPTVCVGRITPHVEALQGVVLHLIVSHPAIQQMATEWSVPYKRAIAKRFASPRHSY